ncbi:lipoprotein-releasing ABC transporter permease subunit [Parvibaculum sp.]|jgi:lipoprotein-releasing system permease protein|uniref:lipoprotein-releasing ABC transporter permease subunit n=2 Tax=Parvibaculum sp. TaxID=2024848 RepID=UPI001B1D9BB9|nr:lipoprotein-releasing ABC transporter permease subunit [Parvibaculum sp.]MBO6679056.1 lipoprotein-releasing ABC transporter permease subunit [Parvibaculum sp.]MBO6684977.1 lipoprotein-releasing ABC transporter permease subunit [Parvibaculum sp.]MBO6903795.1 lipoprotein-releasing ABC transporter permease subunit [Parvibaculum sp.]
MTDAVHPRAKSAGRSRAFGAFEWLLAMRYLRSRRREGIVSVIAGISFAGIMLGVATLIIVMSVMNGFRTELLSRILGVNGHMFVQGVGTNITDYDTIAARIAKVPGVVSVAPLVDGQVMVQSARNAGGALVRGMREADLKNLSIVSESVTAGSLDGLDEGGVAVGSRLAMNLGLTVGDNITLLSPKGAITPFGTAPKVGSFPIRAIFELGMSEYDASFVFMSLDEARAFFRTYEGVSALEIRLANPDRVNDFVKPVSVAAGPCCTATTWQQRNESFFSALQVERNVMFLILTLILIVASLNIISGLVMLVKDKGRDIAVLRTMGATRGAVMRAFFISGASIGVAGTLAGFALGLVFCLNIETLRQWLSELSGTELFSPEVYFLSRMPAEVDASEVTAVVLMALFLSFAATLYPAWRAASLDPVEALRYE